MRAECMPDALLSAVHSYTAGAADNYSGAAEIPSG